MNKKTLLYIALALMALVFMFGLIGIFAAHLPMSILAVVFSVAAITCLVLAVFERKQQAAAPTTPAAQQ